MYRNRLKEIRESEDLSQREIAERLGIDKRTYQHYEAEYNIMPLKYLNQVCCYFDVSLDYVFELVDIKNYVGVLMMIDIKKSGERIKVFRKEYNLTQNELAEFLNVAQPLIVNYEKGKNLISTSFLYSICKKYKISAEYLLGKIDTPKYLN